MYNSFLLELIDESRKDEANLFFAFAVESAIEKNDDSKLPSHEILPTADQLYWMCLLEILLLRRILRGKSVLDWNLQHTNDISLLIEFKGGYLPSLDQSFIAQLNLS